ncbi:MAG: diaminopimelate decarboxylase [Anaerolineaceae bacterium]|nr:diaminopimelate decarboxylase [Anaerolineaceae bacterium]
MVLNSSVAYVDGMLSVDKHPVSSISAEMGTPLYIYSLPRALANYERLKEQFSSIQPDIHYSAKANGNLAILKALIKAGAGIDVVSGGEFHRALKAGARGEDIVFAGVGKTPEDMRYALENHVGWFNVENIDELGIINQLTASLGLPPTKIAMRLNPDVKASTHQHIATGHGTAKFGLSAAIIRDVFQNQANYPHLHFAGIHIHIGSQLQDTQATLQALQTAVELISPYEDIRTVNIGGGIPVAYRPDEQLPDVESFAKLISPVLKSFRVIMEPGRSIIADAGFLVTRVLYIKEQAGQRVVIVDASMTELIRPALYQAYHHILPVKQTPSGMLPTQVVGPVCESTDVLSQQVDLPVDLKPGDLLAVLTAGAYGMVMASNYNARPRPAEVVISEDSQDWHVVRRRETWEDLIQQEI